MCIKHYDIVKYGNDGIESSAQARRILFSRLSDAIVREIFTKYHILLQRIWKILKTVIMERKV